MEPGRPSQGRICCPEVFRDCKSPRESLAFYLLPSRKFALWVTGGKKWDFVNIKHRSFLAIAYVIFGELEMTHILSPRKFTFSQLSCH